MLPFQNNSKAPGLEWIGEAFSEILGQKMESPSTFVISRDDRLYAFDRVGIPAGAQLSRATLLKIAEQMDVDYVVFGSFNYDGHTFTSRSQLLDMRQLHLDEPVTESGPLLQLAGVQAAIAWDLLHEIEPSFELSKQDFVSESQDIRLDALESYVRGVIGSSSAERIRHFKDAIRLNPDYAVAILQLGKTYFGDRDYTAAATWLARVPQGNKHALEANFFLGLAEYYRGNLEKSADAFRFVLARLPLTEIYNNLGVVEARLHQSSSVDDLQKATQADPSDEDYRFNLAVSLATSGNTTEAIRQLKEAINLRPSDSEAKSYLEELASTTSIASTKSPARPPLERLKHDYNEASFRQLAFAIENAEEQQMAHADPKKHATMHLERGEQQLRQGFYEDARDSFRKAINLDPDNVDAHLGLAKAQIALNDLNSARTELYATLHNKPSSEAYVALAQLDIKENKTDAASDDIAKALSLEPANSAALQLKQQLASRMEARQ